MEAATASQGPAARESKGDDNGGGLATVDPPPRPDGPAGRLHQPARGVRVQGQNKEYQPQNEFKLDPWISIEISGLDLSIKQRSSTWSFFVPDDDDDDLRAGGCRTSRT